MTDLVPDPHNRRLHPEANLEMLTRSLQTTGAARSIVIDEDNEILAGNGVVQAAKAAGLTHVRIIETDGTELIAVRRRDLTPDAKRALAIFDNRTAELAVWNVPQLEADLKAGQDLHAFFSDKELVSFWARHDKDGLAPVDDLPKPRPVTIQRGDLFELGPHRLLCGDATDEADVTRLLAGAEPVLMVTDPPYGVDYDPTWRRDAGVNKNPDKLGTVLNDDQADWYEAWRLFPGVAAYVWHAALKSAIVEESLKRAGFEPRAQVIWAKDRLVLGRGDYHWQHEPCWYAVRDGATGRRTSDRSPATLWRIATPKATKRTTLWEVASREDSGHGHGTQKPVECMARPMRYHEALEVYDPFVGSGSTVIAAEQLGRRCFAMDLTPACVQMTIDRWEAFAGEAALKIGTATAPPAAPRRRTRTTRGAT